MNYKNSIQLQMHLRHLFVVIDRFDAVKLAVLLEGSKECIFRYLIVNELPLDFYRVSIIVFEGNDFEEVRPTEAERLVREDEDGDWDAARDSESDLELGLRV